MRFESSGAGAAAITSFSDSFNRASGRLGKNWDCVFLTTEPTFATPFGAMRADIGAITGGAQGLRFTYQGQANPNYIYGVVIVPSVSTGLSIYTSTKEFAQATFNATTGNQSGLGIYLNPELLGGTGVLDQEGYFLQLAGSGNSKLFRMNGTGYTSLNSTLPAAAQNDVWRLAADSSTAGQTVVTVSQNGTVQLTYTDSSANRINRGLPGMLQNSGNQTTFGEYTNFSCGIGT